MVCLTPEQLEQWNADRRDFLAILPSHATRASRSSRFRLCLPEIRKKLRLFCRLNFDTKFQVMTSQSMTSYETRKFSLLRKRF